MADTDWERAQRTTYVGRQTISYRYAAPIRDLRQRLMLVAPARHGDQLTHQWGLDVSVDARGREWQDRFGNRVVDLAVDAVDTEIVFEAWSLIERRAPTEPYPVAADAAWTRPTKLTRADRVLADAADQLVAAGPGGVALGERICQWVHQNLAYRHDVTSIHTTASAALALGSGCARTMPTSPSPCVGEGGWRRATSPVTCWERGAATRGSRC